MSFQGCCDTDGSRPMKCCWDTSWLSRSPFRWQLRLPHRSASTNSSCRQCFSFRSCPRSQLHRCSWFGLASGRCRRSSSLSFFPIVIDAAVGLRSMSSEMMDLARSMGASRTQIFTQFRLPTSLPYLFSGLKVAATRAIAGAVVGEFVGADKGLGYLLLVTNSNMETALMFSTLVGLTFIGLVFFYSVEFLESLLIPWHVTHRIREESGTM